VGHSRREVVKDVVDGDSETADARLASALVRLDGNTFPVVHAPRIEAGAGFRQQDQQRRSTGCREILDGDGLGALQPHDPGREILIHAADGRPIGVEITAPEAATLDRINAVLERLGQPLLPEQELRPLTAA
jgi:hypothetical protein